MGGTSSAAIHHPANLVHLCYPCHAVVEAQRTWAKQVGLLVSKHSPTPTEPWQPEPWQPPPMA